MPYDYRTTIERLWLTTMKFTKEMAGGTTDIFPEFSLKSTRKITEKSPKNHRKSVRKAIQNDSDSKSSIFRSEFLILYDLICISYMALFYAKSGFRAFGIGALIVYTRSKEKRSEWQIGGLKRKCYFQGYLE